MSPTTITSHLFPHTSLRRNRGGSNHSFTRHGRILVAQFQVTTYRPLCRLRRALSHIVPRLSIQLNLAYVLLNQRNFGNLFKIFEFSTGIANYMGTPRVFIRPNGTINHGWQLCPYLWRTSTADLELIFLYQTKDMPHTFFVKLQEQVAFYSNSYLNFWILPPCSPVWIFWIINGVNLEKQVLYRNFLDPWSIYNQNMTKTLLKWL